MSGRPAAASVQACTGPVGSGATLACAYRSSDGEGFDTRSTDAAASYNTFTDDTAHDNGVLDAGQSAECVGNTWLNNHFGTTDGI